MYKIREYFKFFNTLTVKIKRREIRERKEELYIVYSRTLNLVDLVYLSSRSTKF